jgi:hypothetical protein
MTGGFRRKCGFQDQGLMPGPSPTQCSSVCKEAFGAVSAARSAYAMPGSYEAFAAYWGGVVDGQGPFVPYGLPSATMGGNSLIVARSWPDHSWISARGRSGLSLRRACAVISGFLMSL